MTDSFGVDIAGDTRAVLRFERFPTLAHDLLLATLQSLERRLEAAVLAEEPEKSGELKSLTGGRVYDHGDRIAAVVGVRAMTAQEARKAMALEFGSHRSIEVKAHKASLDHLWSRAFGPIQVNVAGHSRTTNIDAQRFLRGPLDEIRDQAQAEMQAAVDLAIADVS